MLQTLATMLLFYLSIFTTVDAIYIWSTPGKLPTSIPAACRAALSQNLTCSGGLITGQSLAAGRFSDNATLTNYCQSACLSSLQTFQSNVAARCGNTSYQMNVNSTTMQTGPSIADPLVWAYNTSCIRDQGKFCLPAIRNNTVTACSKCALSFGAAMLSNKFGRQVFQPAPFSSLLSSCKVPASSFPYSTAAPTPTPTGSARPTCMGTNYTVKAGDTCQSISSKNSIAIDRLIAANGLSYNCSTLVTGLNLCLGPSCALQAVKANQTCSDIVRGKGFSVVQLLSWNPTIHENCDNLDIMNGRSICISPPGTTSYTESKANTTSSTTPFTPMFTGPWTTGSPNTSPGITTTSWFNTQTNFSAVPTSTYTFNSTRASILAKATTLCPIKPTDMAAGWTYDDLPDACESLLDPYCQPDLNSPLPTSTTFPVVCSPAYYNNMTATSSAGAGAPTPLTPGTTSSCKQYYQILSGDTCYSVSTHFGITLQQFYTWNPNVGSDCSKLLLGYYVCVKA